MKNILCALMCFGCLWSAQVRAEDDFFDQLIISKEDQKQIQDKIQDKENRNKASDILDRKLIDIKFQQKHPQKTLKERRNVFLDAAPFGLLWLATQQEIENHNVKLTPKAIKDSPNCFVATNLPKPVSAFDNVLACFGENNLLWRIIAYGTPISDDNNASKGLKEYQKFYEIFKTKYGHDEEFYTAAVVNIDKEVVLKDGSKSHVIKQRFVEKGDDDFKEKLMSGESVLYATFYNRLANVTLVLTADGEGQTFIVVDYQNLKMNQLEQQEMLDAL